MSKHSKGVMEMNKLPPSWQSLTDEQRKSIIMKLLDQLEVADNTVRMKAARCFLYLAQGCWDEVQSDREQRKWTKINAMMLYECCVFHAFVELLNIEIENNTAANNAIKKISVSLSDSTDLRVILNVLYIVVEVMRIINENDSEKDRQLKENFKADLETEFKDELLQIKLLGMVTRYCSGSSPHFPMRKVLLLLWKVILVSLGGMDTLRQLRREYRKQAGLEDTEEDTLAITRTMRASTPPPSAADLLEGQHQKRASRPFRKSLMKQSSLDEPGMEFDGEGADEDEIRDFDESQPTIENEPMNDVMEFAPRPSTPGKGLPWLPKVRQKDLDTFLENTRIKFVGFSLPGDRETVVGLPKPICEGVKVLKRHMFTSLSEVHILKEELMSKNPFSHAETNIKPTPTEILYQAMLPNLPQYMIALLKILLAAAPTSKTKTDSINIVADVLPSGMPYTMVQSMKLGIDVNRHKEVIVKAVSAILLLLLKHFKLNHIYQFEFMSQHLVFANCIPLVLKFFNQNILAYVSTKNIIPSLDFPACVIGDQPELNRDILDLDIDYSQPYSWRNIYSCINLLRILNKLTKWKHSRIMMLVVFKSAPILKRTLKVRHALMQLYVLKLLKMQTKYLGRQWRKTNMKTMSAIYQKVRHRLNDDWAFGNDVEARPWDFQAEEYALRTCVDRFNNRRYNNVPADPELEPVDSCVISVLGKPLELTEEFKQHYEVWLEQEVMKMNVNWDLLLCQGYMG
ncbi:UNVERIFIED_CONTAM: hypothetical protein PYX00_009539 [Menopon gallinae]|uniref:Striatin-interacting protein 1 n=1 Tax=Menopon gallinae TaxID=328185 RepID=A0AAW2HC60_9NEOP